MNKRRIVIATRESPLAMRQAEWVKVRLNEHCPALTVELLGIKTVADQQLEIRLSRIGGKGLFVKELEEALLDGRADIAVHSMKDVPAELPPGLCLPVICEREDPSDVFVSGNYAALAALPYQAKVGTSSLRRQAQLQILRSDIVVEPLRGNIHTRLKRLDAGDYSAIILAAAGLKRMALGSRICEYFSFAEMLPASGQGALGIECRTNDHAVRTLIAALDHAPTHTAVRAERALCRRLNGGCQAPVAAHADIHDGILTLQGLVASCDGQRVLRVQCQGAPDQAENIGWRAGEELCQQGAEKILQEAAARTN